LKKLIFALFISTTLISCIISEQELNSATYTGDSELHIKTENDIVKSFSLNTSSGTLSLNGYWDIINNSFYIETFSEGQDILILGKFDTDSTVYGDWSIDNNSGNWNGNKNIDKTTPYVINYK